MGYAVGILTLSDMGARGEREDKSGQVIRELLAGDAFSIACAEVLPDDRATIEGTLGMWADERRLALVVTTGGTGLGPRDVTPEATRAVIEYEV
ncbi:MAG TPA: molybdopterin-binding protein, partial [Stenomitos sp.]